MTFHRLLSAGLFALTLGGVGCAVLPDAIGGDNTCGLRQSTSGDEGGCALIPAGDASADGQTLVWDAGLEASGPNQLARSSLCGGGCVPDDSLACLEDGGDAASEGCRVVLGAGQQTSTECEKSGQGNDGDSCTSGSDCAPGFECVGTAGTCRHYCCEDDVCNALSNGPYDTYFCDIAAEHAASGATVPICQLAKGCQLFGMDQCGAGQECTIVDPGGGKNFMAACVDVGDVTEGHSCETHHCAEGLACLGSVGKRTCQEICDEQHPCSPNSSEPNCNVKSPALADLSGAGVCGS
jgi:hypothetical protein